MDAPLWIAATYGVLEVDPMNSCLTVMDVPGSVQGQAGSTCSSGKLPMSGGWEDL